MLHQTLYFVPWKLFNIVDEAMIIMRCLSDFWGDFFIWHAGHAWLAHFSNRKCVCSNFWSNSVCECTSVGSHLWVVSDSEACENACTFNLKYKSYNFICKLLANVAFWCVKPTLPYSWGVMAMENLMNKYTNTIMWLSVLQTELHHQHFYYSGQCLC